MLSGLQLPRGSSALGRSTLAIGLVALALVLTLSLQRIAIGRPSLFLFFAAILAAAWFGGLPAGVLAAALSVPAGVYFYWTTQTSHSLSIENLVLIIFFGACAAVGAHVHSLTRAANDALRRSHGEIALKAQALERSNADLLAEIAERQRAEAALRAAQRELVRTSRLNTMGQLSASIAHEVNQPLTAVMSNAASCVRWLESDTADLEEAKAAARRVVRDTERASGIIRKVREMVRRGLPEMIPVNLNDTIHGALDLAAVEIDTNRIEVRLDLASPLPAIVGDRVQLQQLFLNIVLNAIDAMRGHSAVRKLHVRSFEAARQLVVEFEDTGPGGPPEIAQRLFEAFVTTKEQGMGLGLSICRTIAEGHGGSIAAFPASPSGAIFRLTFPVGVVSHE